MKTILLSVLMFAGCIFGVMAQNDAIEVYRNDGQVNAFMKAYVDSIKYSRVDLDGLSHENYVVQEVWTPDSVYRIPLTANDILIFASLCPEGNHPQAIDLGLPSGTKWCSHNVGALSPEDYGGYYAWGETTEKSYYSERNYAYYDVAREKYINIGHTISGTKYDVAHMVMGGRWRIPNHEQLKELMRYCTCHEATLNGVYGMLIVGSGSGQVFLPAAGQLWDDHHGTVGSYGCYWLDSGSSYADYFYFKSGFLSYNAAYRYTGQSVRAVCPK